MVGERIREMFNRPSSRYGGRPSIAEMKATKIAYWTSMYPSGLSKMAVQFADEWARSIAERYAPPELRNQIMEYVYPQGLEMADKWLRAIRA
jgi:hypothetical protein